MKLGSVLDKEYGTDFICYLNYETPWQLLIAVILSAQCTDARVNIVTADLFKKYPTLEDFAAADLKELEQDIHSIGFYHMKAKNIIQCAKRLVEEYGGVVPEKLEDLLTLAGVGRKTANVIRGNIYHVPSIVVDTHVKRISPDHICRLSSYACQCKKILQFFRQEAGPYKRNRAGKDRSGPYEGAARRSLDPLEYPYHHTGTDHLYSQKTGLRELFFKTMVSCL